jgi:hypothetical protein
MISNNLRHKRLSAHLLFPKPSSNPSGASARIHLVAVLISQWKNKHDKEIQRLERGGRPCPRFPPSMTIASAIFPQDFWLAGSLVLAPFAFGFLISNSTY